MSNENQAEITAETEPNIKMTPRDLDIILQDGVVAYKYYGKNFKNGILMIVCVKRESVDANLVNDPDFQNFKHYSCLVFLLDEKMLYHIMQKNIVHIIHIEPPKDIEKYCPTEFWIMTEQVYDKYFDRNDELTPEEYKNFKICEDTQNIKVRYGL